MSTVGNYWTRQTKINCTPQAEEKSEIEANIPNLYKCLLKYMEDK